MYAYKHFDKIFIFNVYTHHLKISYTEFRLLSGHAYYDL